MVMKARQKSFASVLFAPLTQLLSLRNTLTGYDGCDHYSSYPAQIVLHLEQIKVVFSFVSLAEACNSKQWGEELTGNARRLLK